MVRRQQSKALARISALKLQRALKGKLSPEIIHDGGGLYLRILPSSASWIFRYQRDNVPHSMGLGTLLEVGGPEARELARQHRSALAAGLDPLLERQRERRTVEVAQVEERAKLTTFKSFADPILAQLDQSQLNKKHKANWRQSIVAYCYPVIGDLALDDIEPRHVLDILKPIWGTKIPTARRVRQRLEQLLDDAALHKLRSKPNPARLPDLKRALSRYSTERVRGHHAALPWREVPALMTRLRKDGDVSSHALMLTILSATRAGETLGARFPEFANGTWTIPAERMKGEHGRRREHRVPITAGITAIVKAMDRVKRSDLLFPGRTSQTPISSMAMLMKLRRMKVEATVHGFRSSFRDFAAENNFPREVAEAALAHVVGGVEGAYLRSDLFDLRRDLMQAWSDFCLTGKLSRRRK